GMVRIGVRDFGEGIAPADHTKLFRKFSQIDSGSTRKVGGTGLGLVISKGIVEQHGGAIWVESTYGEGSTFYFTLPLAESGSPAAERPRVAGPPRPRPARLTAPRTPLSVPASRSIPPTAGDPGNGRAPWTTPRLDRSSPRSPARSRSCRSE